MKKNLLWSVLVWTGLLLSVSIVKAESNPFAGRDYRVTQNFFLSHVAKMEVILPSGDGLNSIYVMSVSEPYFSWAKMVVRMPQGWRNLRVGDTTRINMAHTTSDVPLTNSQIEEGFFHSLLNLDNISYFGFFESPAHEVTDIQLEKCEGISEAGRYTYYLVHIRFKDGQEKRIHSPVSVNLSDIAKSGELILMADGFVQHEHHYQENLFGNKRVFQKHWMGPYSTEPLYRRSAYTMSLFNLSRGTMVSF